MNDDLTSILAEALDEFLYSAQQSSVGDHGVGAWAVAPLASEWIYCPYCLAEIGL